MSLSSLVHDLSKRAISGEFGKLLREIEFSLDGDPSLIGLTGNRLYAEMVRQTAARVPIRLIPGLLIAGSAALPQARQHRAPLSGMFGSDHTTPGFDRVLHMGYRNLRSKIRSRLAQGDMDDEGKEFLESMLICLDGARIWHERYLSLLSTAVQEAPSDGLRENYRRALAAFRNVPEKPPQTFHEALQSLWFSFAFLRLFGNWPGLGRIDQMLWPYLKKDLEAGRITISEARELLAHFWVMGVEWADGDTPNPQIWDGMYYQNVVLGGVDADGQEVTNPVTYLVLDVIEALHICDFPVAIRLNRHTPDRLIQRIVEVVRQGGGIVSVYNEEVVLDALCDFGYPIEEARRFANDGCWEVLIPGRTNFQYRPHDMLLIVQKLLRIEDPDSEIPDYPDFESLYHDFYHQLELKILDHHTDADTYGLAGMVAPLFSIFYQDCIENARGYHDRGCKYTALSLQFAGLPDTANALYAIKEIVYRQQWVSMAELISALRANWEGYEVLRQRIRRELDFYGNGNPAVDGLAARIINDFADLMSACKERDGTVRPWGISSFGGQVGMAAHRQAMPFGSFSNTILASNLSPTPGTEKKGPTIVMGSYCSLPLERLPIGTALELKLHPSLIEGQRGLKAWKAILKTFVNLGGFYLQVDVVDSEILKQAQAHPEQFSALTVRVGGWSARFVALSPEYQQMIIERTEHQST